jgi:ATP-dependent Lon protease
VTQFESYVKLNKKVPPEVVASITQIDDFRQAGRLDCSAPAIKIPKSRTAGDRFGQGPPAGEGLGLMEGEISVLQVEKRIRSRVKRQMEKTQREYYLNEQMKAIQKELGDGEDGRRDGSNWKSASARPSSPRKPARRPTPSSRSSSR